MTALAISELLEYTDWERQKWRDWLGAHPEMLAVSAGPHGDGRFQSVADLVRHIWTAEARYIERLSGLPLTDPASIPSDSVESIFAFGAKTRANLRQFIERTPAEQWDVMLELPFVNNSILAATTRKIVVQILTHEIRHWAQIATILRLAGHSPEIQDFIFSPVLGGELRRAKPAP